MPPYFVPDWVKAAQTRTDTGGIAISRFDELETVQIPSSASRVDFRADTTTSVLSIAWSTLNEQDPGAPSNFFFVSRGTVATSPP